METKILEVESMADGELEAALMIEEGAIEAYGRDSVAHSRAFWKSVENKHRILREMRRRAYDRSK